MGVDDSAIERVLDFVEHNYAQQTSVQQLARIAGMSVPRFAATFRRRLGTPPYRYVCDLRVRRAQALLGQGHRAAVVAAETGFFDQSHMVRHFKRVCGATPRHFMGRA